MITPEQGHAAHAKELKDRVDADVALLEVLFDSAIHKYGDLPVWLSLSDVDERDTALDVFAARLGEAGWSVVLKRPWWTHIPIFEDCVCVMPRSAK